MRQRSSLAIVIICCLALLGASAAPLLAVEPATVESAVSVDPRVELVSIVFYLSGGSDYNLPNQYRPYQERVNRWFSRFKDHPAVRYAIKLRNDDGISFNAPMGLAIRISPDPSMKLLVPLEPWPERFDDRWTPHTVRAFLKRLRSFRRDSDFDAFYRENTPFYNEITARLGSVVHRELHMEWFPSFFGSGALREGTVHIVPGALLGPCNYGPSVRIAGRVHRYVIIGVWRTDGKGQPIFRHGDISTVVHEVCHSFSNPVVQRWMHQLRPLFAELQSRHEKAFGAQGYGDPESIAYETMVRACVERYLLDTDGKAAAREHAEEQRKRGFLWVGDLCRLLGTYEKDRTRYPDLDAFMPRIVAFLHHWIATHPVPTPAPAAHS
ncbi:MAG: DUF4932 domain-containing protein [Acidobacteria bacterium]|nr:DUF4932 domain-containing protein [Acidobacteriota bacterium]